MYTLRGNFQPLWESLRSRFSPWFGRPFKKGQCSRLVKLEICFPQPQLSDAKNQRESEEDEPKEEESWHCQSRKASSGGISCSRTVCRYNKRLLRKRVPFLPNVFFFVDEFFFPLVFWNFPSYFLAIFLLINNTTANHYFQEMSLFLSSLKESWMSIDLPKRKMFEK